ncbi:MAG: hypothetical protein WAU86_16565 [Oricola sp.]
MKKSYLIMALLLAGCSTESGDRPDVPDPREVARVRVVDTVPANVGRFSNLSATICKNGPLDLPSRDQAMQLLRTRAYQNGYLTMHSVTVGTVQGSLAKSCPGGVQARGIGFSLAKPTK